MIPVSHDVWWMKFLWPLLVLICNRRVNVLYYQEIDFRNCRFLDDKWRVLARQVLEWINFRWFIADRQVRKQRAYVCVSQNEATETPGCKQDDHSPTFVVWIATCWNIKSFILFPVISFLFLFALLALLNLRCQYAEEIYSKFLNSLRYGRFVSHAFCVHVRN